MRDSGVQSRRGGSKKATYEEMDDRYACAAASCNRCPMAEEAGLGSLIILYVHEKMSVSVYLNHAAAANISYMYVLRTCSNTSMSIRPQEIIESCSPM